MHVDVDRQTDIYVAQHCVSALRRRDKNAYDIMASKKFLIVQGGGGGGGGGGGEGHGRIYRGDIRK